MSLQCLEKATRREAPGIQDGYRQHTPTRVGRLQVPLRLPRKIQTPGKETAWQA